MEDGKKCSIYRVNQIVVFRVLNLVPHKANHRQAAAAGKNYERELLTAKWVAVLVVFFFPSWLNREKVRLYSTLGFPSAEREENMGDKF